MKYLRQTVALTFDKSGNPLFITREFGDDIEALLNRASTSTTVDLTSILARIGALEAQDASLLLLINDLQEEVRKLKGGYQS